jgi:hypothetical protein
MKRKFVAKNSKIKNKYPPVYDKQYMNIVIEAHLDYV